MNLFSIWELKRFTRTELHALLDRVMLVIDEEPEGSFHHEVALTNYRNIRWVLANYSAVTNTPSPR